MNHVNRVGLGPLQPTNLKCFNDLVLIILASYRLDLWLPAHAFRSIVVMGLFSMDLCWLSFVTNINCRWQGSFHVITYYLALGLSRLLWCGCLFFYSLVVGFLASIVAIYLSVSLVLLCRLCTTWGYYLIDWKLFDYMFMPN